MNYQDTVSWLFNQLPFYQKDGKYAYKKDLDNVFNFFKKYGKDWQFFDKIHIAGTNGKGSVSHMLSSIIQESGLKVGLFTSPHLFDFRERIKINGEKISQEFIIHFVKKHKQDFIKMKMSFFEMNVAIAFKYFSYNKVDIAIIEVGLGGRLDATNIITPILSIITNISMDHQNLLGDSLELIAKEKAGIIKKNRPVLMGEKGEYIDSITSIASNLNSPLFYSKKCNYSSALKGDYQLENINTAVTAIDILNQNNYKISKKNITTGLQRVIQNTGFCGRWQLISKEPLVICDIAHNIAALQCVFTELNSMTVTKHIILGFSRDKDFNNMIEALPNDGYHYYICGSLNQRIISPHHLIESFTKCNLSFKVFDFSYNAYIHLMKNDINSDLIMITGSTFIVSDILKYLDKS